MTKKQFRKSRRCINATKFARVFSWIRLFVTILSFIAVGASLAWVAISGATTNAYTLTASSSNVFEFMCKATDDLGNTLNSAVVTYTVQ